MKTLPYFRWFAADAETDALYSDFTLEELGLFHRLLNLSWLRNGLPADLNVLARKVGLTGADFDVLWLSVGKAWEERGGKLYNPRQEEERTHALNRSKKSADSVRTRYERRTNVDTNEHTDVLPRAYGSDSVSVVSSTTEESTTKNKTTTEISVIRARDQFAEADQFEMFWDLFRAAGKALNEMDREHSLRLWLNHDPLVHEQIVAWVVDQMKTVWRDERYTPMPQNALQSRGWTRKSIQRIIPDPNDPTVKLMRYRAAQRERGTL